MISPKIAVPFIIQEATSNEPTVQKDPFPENNTTMTSGVLQAFLAGALVYIAGTAVSTPPTGLNELATAGTVIFGQSPDSAVGAGLIVPPNRLFGYNHYCFDLRDRILEINIASSTAGIATIGTANGVAWNGTGTNGVALLPGQQYGVINPTSGIYKGIQMLDVNNTTQKLFEIVQLAPNVGIADNNPRIWVKVIPSVLQGAA